eukprot:4944779-Amphidinium_carterae.1
MFGCCLHGDSTVWSKFEEFELRMLVIGCLIDFLLFHIVLQQVMLGKLSSRSSQSLVAHSALGAF